MEDFLWFVFGGFVILCELGGIDFEFGIFGLGYLGYLPLEQGRGPLLGFDLFVVLELWEKLWGRWILLML